jgi:N-dimethylarginine dimethylaminohydrolase
MQFEDKLLADKLFADILRMPRVLMCPPDYYGIRYEINPWMSTRRPADRATAERQWYELLDRIFHCGVRIDLVEPTPEQPDLVFTANAALIYEDLAVLSRFKHPQRQGEQPIFARRLAEIGFTIEEPPAGWYFEGAGDALFWGETLVAGYRQRSDALGCQHIARRLGVHALPLELADPYYYHLDTCFCPLDEETAIVYWPAFDAYGRRALEGLGRRLIEATADEAANFACNAVVIDRHVLTNTGCPALHDALDSAGWQPHAVPLGEFVKAGGSAKCLTLRLDGEDAAAWRQRRA